MKWEDAYYQRDDLTPFGAEGIGVFALVPHVVDFGINM